MELALLQSALVESKDELDRLAPAIHRLAAETMHGHDTTGLPDYFLPRVSDTRRPRVVVCYEQGHLVGVVYTEELLFAGRPTGWVFGGDRMGRGLVLAAPEREAEVIATACEYLLANGVHALRLWWRSTGNEILPVLQLQRPGLQVWCKSEIRPQGDWLHLDTSYENFLNALGPHTRRNLRYYRRRAEEEGYRFVPELSLAAYESAAHSLNHDEDSPETREHEQRDQRFFAQFRNQFGSQFGPPVLAGLAAPDGRLVSVLSGVRAGNHLHLLSQFNDESLHAVSPSLVLRGYLIERLIAQGIASIHFVNGTSGPLARFCDPVLMRTLSIDSRRSALHPVKLATATAARGWQRRGRWVPVRLRGLLGSYMAAV
ncbi:MAG TPA: GNAT family N-acetyltransferase [Terracidiphilus sp.]|nr:GNAT family N-acetyltransferase [Terracidiphilus sp.]